MIYYKIKFSIAIFLIFSIVFTTIAPGFARAKQIKVVFVGIKFEGFPSDIKASILERVMSLFTTEPTLQFMGPNDLREVMSSEKIVQFLHNMDHTSFSALAEKLNADYVYAGRIANNRQNSGRILQVGELYRYDHASNLRHKFEVLKYYEDFSVELMEFKNEFVKTIIPQASSGKKIVPYLIFAGIIVAAISAFTLVKVNGGASGESKPHHTDP